MASVFHSWLLVRASRKAGKGKTYLYKVPEMEWVSGVGIGWANHIMFMTWHLVDIDEYFSVRNGSVLWLESLLQCAVTESVSVS